MIIINQSAGIFFYSKSTQRYLYLLRNENKNPTWSIPGGKIEKNETLLSGLKRECQEEIAYWDDEFKLVPIQKFVNNTFAYHTFFCEIEEEFSPLLNDEHCGYAWVGNNRYPKPLHPGLFSTINIDTVVEKLKALQSL
jgi:8-oxo-dGTP pyrophosphatase MutT (NUDIX family)|tara:strand:- start:630 stop:1043 length:414 start_codon:yes stop_codon:yes gene_type:complete